jgi:LTXXQ motif family protein
MRKTMKLNKLSVAFLAFLTTAGAAVAQGAGMPGAVAAGAGMACAADQHIDGQLAFIKAELKVTDEQMPSWNVFANTFRANKEKQAATCAQTLKQMRAMQSANLLDSMKVMETRLADQLESLRAMDAAIRPLYESLSPEQRKKADQILRGGPGM